MDGWLEGRKRALLRCLSLEAPLTLLSALARQNTSNHKMTLRDHVSDQTVQWSADALPRKPRVPSKLPGSWWEGARRSLAGHMLWPPPELPLGQPHYCLVHALGLDHSKSKLMI